MQDLHLILLVVQPNRFNDDEQMLCNGPMLSVEQRLHMYRSFTTEDVKQLLFSIPYLDLLL